MESILKEKVSESFYKAYHEIHSIIIRTSMSDEARELLTNALQNQIMLECKDFTRLLEGIESFQYTSRDKFIPHLQKSRQPSKKF